MEKLPNVAILLFCTLLQICSKRFWYFFFSFFYHAASSYLEIYETKNTIYSIIFIAKAWWITIDTNVAIKIGPWERVLYYVYKHLV